VPKGVVDLLHTIQVEKKDQCLLGEPLSPLHLLVGKSKESSSVIQSGEIIHQREAPELLNLFLLLFEVESDNGKDRQPEDPDYPEYDSALGAIRTHGSNEVINRKRNTDPSPNVTHFIPLTPVTFKALWFHHQWSYILKKISAIGTSGELRPMIGTLLEALQGCFLPEGGSIAGANGLQAGDMDDDIVSLQTDLGKLPGHVGGVDQGQLLAVLQDQIPVWDLQIGVGLGVAVNLYVDTAV